MNTEEKIRWMFYFFYNERKIEVWHNGDIKLIDKNNEKIRLDIYIVNT